MRGTFQRLFGNLNALVGVSQGMRAVRGARGGLMQIVLHKGMNR